MNKYLLIIALSIFSFNVEAGVRTVCANGDCHLVNDLGNGNYTVDGGEIHNARSLGGNNYSIDGELHNIRPLGSGNYSVDGNLVHFQ